jgi:hypothetical protein
VSKMRESCRLVCCGLVLLGRTWYDGRLAYELLLTNKVLLGVASGF